MHVVAEPERISGLDCTVSICQSVRVADVPPCRLWLSTAQLHPRRNRVFFLLGSGLGAWL